MPAGDPNGGGLTRENFRFLSQVWQNFPIKVLGDNYMLFAAWP